MMARFCIDIFILSVLSKELWQLFASHQLPSGFFLLSLVGLSFFLGMGSDPESEVIAIRHPIGSLIRTGVAVISMILYLAMQSMQGTLASYALILAFSILVYISGRIVGMALKGFAFLFLWLVVAYYLVRFMLPPQ